MTTSRLHSLDIRLSHAFAVMAEENNISRAAQRLFISQPLLTRHVCHLETRLGVTLFQRHSKGLTLTDTGREVLEMTRPLLALQERTLAALSQLPAYSPQPLRLGLTIASEQGIFAAAESALSDHTRTLHIIRHASPVLVQQVRKSKLDAMLVALPLNTEGLHLHPLSYQEPLIAALSASWPEAATPALMLHALSHRPLSWFKRECNPDFFDYTRRILNRAGYTPAYVEEPAEHNVLLACIARGEGMIFLPASFSAIQRQGVVFCPVVEGDSTPLSFDVVYAPHQAESVQQWFSLLNDRLTTGQSQAEHRATLYWLQSEFFRLVKHRKMNFFHFRGLFLTPYADFSIDARVFFRHPYIWTSKRTEVRNITAITCD